MFLQVSWFAQTSFTVSRCCCLCLLFWTVEGAVLQQLHKAILAKTVQSPWCLVECFFFFFNDLAWVCVIRNFPRSNLLWTAPQSEEGKGFSLEEKSKKASKRVHYMKFTKGELCFFFFLDGSKEQQQQRDPAVFHVLTLTVLSFHQHFSSACCVFESQKDLK